MRYSLRTLLIWTILVPPALALIFREAEALGFEVLAVEALALGMTSATSAFCVSFLWGPR